MKLTNNFTKSEFDCKCGCDMPTDVFFNIQKLANQLQYLRDLVDKPIKINSGYRCVKYNKKIGGSVNSQHIQGKASDIVIKGINPDDTADLLEKLISEGDMLQGGLGRYNTFTHYDIRGNKARWNFKK